MDVICKRCGHVHSFKITVTDYLGFVCANCHSYFKGTTLEALTFVKEFSPALVTQWAKLGEQVQFKKNSYWIITKIQRFTNNSEYGNESVGLNENKDDIYFSDGVDYSCVLFPVDKEKVRLISKGSNCEFERRNYNLEYTDQQRVIYAEGFVFEDLELETTCNTYIQALNEDRFISQEFIGNDVEYYQGAYFGSETYCRIFDSYNDYASRKEIAGVKFRNIGVAAILVLAALFWMLNWRQIGKDEYKFDEKFFGKKANAEFVGASFELKGNQAKRLVLQGISEVKNQPLSLTIKLVNEKTNEIIEAGSFVHENNDINYANGLTVDFCRIEPGIYHLVFATSSTSDTPMDFELSEDYKLSYGGTNYVLLIAVLIGLVILLFDYRKKLLDIQHKDVLMRSESLSYSSILKFRKMGLVLAGSLLLFAILNIVINSSTDCSMTIRTSSLEDHTYTGSRSHYRRSYYGGGGLLDGSGHK